MGGARSWADSMLNRQRLCLAAARSTQRSAFGAQLVTLTLHPTFLLQNIKVPDFATLRSKLPSLPKWKTAAA